MTEEDIQKIVERFMFHHNNHHRVQVHFRREDALTLGLVVIGANLAGAAIWEGSKALWKKYKKKENNKEE